MNDKVAQIKERNLFGPKIRKSDEWKHYLYEKCNSTWVCSAASCGSSRKHPMQMERQMMSVEDLLFGRPVMFSMLVPLDRNTARDVAIAEAAKVLGIPLWNEEAYMKERK